MRKPRSSNSVSAIQRFSAIRTSHKETAGTRPGRSIFIPEPPGSGVLTAQQFVDADALGGKRLAQHWNARVGIGGATHENVQRGIADFRPGVDGDVALRQHRHAGHPAGLKVVQVNMQQCRAGGLDAAPQRRLDVLDIVEALGAVQIDDQMNAGAADAVTRGEMIFAVERLASFLRYGSRHFQLRLPVFLSGGTWDPQALHRSQEGVLAHAVLPNLDQNPRCRRTGATESESRPISPREPTNSG